LRGNVPDEDNSPCEKIFSAFHTGKRAVTRL